jgi:hypothetical protein
MNLVFSFFLRLFVCFVAAKLVVLAADLNSRTYLVCLTVLLLVHVYLLDYLVFRQGRAGRAGPSEAAPKKDAGGPPAPDRS